VLEKKNAALEKSKTTFKGIKSNPKKNFVSTDRGIAERVVEFVVVLKIPWEDFKVSNCMALRFSHLSGK